MIIRNNKKIILFPIDTVSRELEWQLILACHMAQHGNTSVIGRSGFLRRRHKQSENCIWFGRLPSNNGRSPSDLEVLQYGKNNDTRFLFLHDEGGFFSLKDYDELVKIIHPVEESHLQSNFKILTWGEYQKKYLQTLVTNRSLEIDTSGMPRFDLYSKRYDWMDSDAVNKIKDQHGDFILITTKFANANSNEFEGGLITEKFLLRYKDKGDEFIQEMFEKWKKDHIDWSAFVTMLNYIFHHNPDKRFILRPHPSENSKFYKDVFKGYSNVKVIREGDVRPWIKAANEVVHSGCTTGFEAILAGKKVINFIPEVNKKSDYNIAIAIESGVLATEKEQVNKFLHTKLEDLNQEFSEDAKQKLLNISESSIEKCIELLQAEKDRPAYIGNIDSPLRKYLRRLKHRITGNDDLTKTMNEKGKRVRQADLPRERITEIVNLFNKVNNSKIRILHFDIESVIVSN